MAFMSGNTFKVIVWQIKLTMRNIFKIVYLYESWLINGSDIYKRLNTLPDVLFFFSRACDESFEEKFVDQIIALISLKSLFIYKTMITEVYSCL